MSNKSFKVACRLCGEIWTFPYIYKDAIKPGWECPYCKRKWKNLHENDLVK